MPVIIGSRLRKTHPCVVEQLPGSILVFRTTFAPAVPIGTPLVVVQINDSIAFAFDRDGKHICSSSAAVPWIALLLSLIAPTLAAVLRCHFMTRVMGSHFFTRESRRSAVSQPRISRGCALSMTVPCWPSSCNSNVREREVTELIFEPRDQPRTPGRASTRRRKA